MRVLRLMQWKGFVMRTRMLEYGVRTAPAAPGTRGRRALRGENTDMDNRPVFGLAAFQATSVPRSSTGAALGASEPLPTCALLVGDKLALGLHWDTRQAFAAARESPQALCLRAGEKGFVDKDISHGCLYRIQKISRSSGT